MKTACVVGLGYIGLPTAVMLATNGWRVIGVDIDPRVVEAVNSGRAPIDEPKIGELVRGAVADATLVAQADVPSADVFVITVPTPVSPDKRADLASVAAASASIAARLEPSNLVVLESTVPPRATVEIVQPALEKSGLKAGTDFFLAYCPERVLPGTILREIVENDRVVGGVTQESADRAAEFYRTFATGSISTADTTTAELVKLSENTYRDVNIALANELSRLCASLGTNVWEVIRHANRHPRVDILSPGPGVGGHCIPVDPWFLVEASPDLATLVRTSRLVNDA
ncbi:MAG: nucleotide sugar dehydrogenase, partial [Proteobacteria bacterium]|nr:nucleotide sugar dehydrogenase [Pseudomonadota bacterium]